MANRNHPPPLANYPERWAQTVPGGANIPARVQQHNDAMHRQAMAYAGPNPLASKPTHRGKR